MSNQTSLSRSDKIAIFTVIVTVVIALVSANQMDAKMQSGLLLIALGATIYLSVKSMRPFWQKVFVISLLCLTYLAIVFWAFEKEARTAKTVAPTTVFLQASMNAVWNMQWRWILFSFILGAAAAELFTIRRIRKRPELFRDRGKNDKLSLTRLVKFQTVEFGEFNLEPDNRPFIEYVFTVFNGSLEPVSVIARVTGRAKYQGQPLDKEPYMTDNKEALHVEYGKHGVFKLRQGLTKDECEQIRKLISANPNLVNDSELDIREVFREVIGKPQDDPFRLSLPDRLKLPFAVPVQLITTERLEKLETEASSRHDNCEREINTLRAQVYRLSEGKTTAELQVAARENEIKNSEESLRQVRLQVVELLGRVNEFQVPAGAIKIKRARYWGTDGNGTVREDDLTVFLEDRFVEGGKLILPKKRYRKMFPRDPLRGVKKQLDIEFTYAGCRFFVAVPEDVSMTLPFPFEEIRE